MKLIYLFLVYIACLSNICCSDSVSQQNKSCKYDHLLTGLWIGNSITSLVLSASFITFGITSQNKTIGYMGALTSLNAVGSLIGAIISFKNIKVEETKMPQSSSSSDHFL